MSFPFPQLLREKVDIFRRVRQYLKIGQVFLLCLFEIFRILGVYRISSGKIHFQKIDIAAILGDAKIQMRPGGKSCCPHIADDLPLSQFFSPSDTFSNTGKVTIAGGIALSVFDLNESSVVTLPTGKDYLSIRNGRYGGALGGGVVDTQMGSIDL